MNVENRSAEVAELGAELHAELHREMGRRAEAIAGELELGQGGGESYELHVGGAYLKVGPEFDDAKVARLLNVLISVEHEVEYRALERSAENAENAENAEDAAERSAERVAAE